MKNLTLTFGIVTLLGGASLAAQHSSMPPGMSHEEHLRQMEKDKALTERGALAMGFDQDKTVHHFLLQESGGAFDKPVATHGELPPGAATMTANAALIRYRYEERAAGASVVLETADAD